MERLRMRSLGRIESNPGRRRSARTAAAATALLALGLAGLGTSPAQAATTTKQVDYQGYQFSVPSSWQVVDLTADPTACVRFDQHAVYLGHPGADQNCASKVAGRTESLLVEPADNAADQQGTVAKTAEQEYDAKASGVTVTATYGTDAALVQRILSSARIPQTAPVATVAPQLAAAALPAGATNYTGKGFDACAAPSSTAMSNWKASSPYSAVGVYIGGSRA